MFAQGRAVRLAGNKFDKSKPKTQQKQKLFVPAAAENTSALVNNACFCLQTLLRGKGASAESFKPSSVIINNKSLPATHAFTVQHGQIHSYCQSNQLKYGINQHAFHKFHMNPIRHFTSLKKHEPYRFKIMIICDPGRQTSHKNQLFEIEIYTSDE